MVAIAPFSAMLIRLRRMMGIGRSTPCCSFFRLMPERLSYLTRSVYTTRSVARPAAGRTLSFLPFLSSTVRTFICLR